MQCTIPAKIKFTKCVDFGLRSCCFKVKCARGVGLRGAILCDAGNYYMDSNGEQKQSRIYAPFTARGTKRPLDGERSSGEPDRSTVSLYAPPRGCAESDPPAGEAWTPPKSYPQPQLVPLNEVLPYAASPQQVRYSPPSIHRRVIHRRVIAPLRCHAPATN